MLGRELASDDRLEPDFEELVAEELSLVVVSSTNIGRG